MSKTPLTAKAIEAAQPQDKPYKLTDSMTPGLFLLVHLSEVVARIKLKLQPGAYYPALRQQQESRMMELMYLKFAKQK
ncbi:CPZ-55 prophage; integrase [Escherichia coli]|uniref:CPZ-55 prophage integrase n=1 Tax=Escherichia coli TaxID=562 RepID=A0A377BUS3_ECOLX|nr:CPZ-55 prophage; integrase [Escherichia coli]